MAEAANVRLVRCPKCENLLPELPDFSLYRCGGCGAVLKAKKKGVPEDGLSEVSDDGRGSGITEGVGIVNGSEVDMERTDGSENGRSPRVHNEKGACGSSSLAPAENREVQTDSNSTRAGKERIRRPEGFDDEYSSRSQGLVRIRNPGKHSELNADRPEYSNFRGQHVIEEIRPPVEPLRSRPLMDQLGVKSTGSTTSGPAGSLASQGRTGNFLYHDEGSSSYGMSSYYQEGGRTRYTGHDNREILENDRIELLRKLDELKDQLSRSCDVADKPPKDTVGPNPTMVPVPPNSHLPYDRYHTAYIQENMSGSHGNKQLLAHDHLEAPYQSHTHGFLRYTDHYDSSGREPYRGYTHKFTGYAHGYHPRPPQPFQYMHRPYHGRYPGFHGDVTHDPFVLHPHENFFHQPACSCVHCYNKNLHLPANVDPLGSHHRRSKNEPSTHNFHDHLNPIPQGPQVYSSGGFKLHPLHSRQSIAMNSSDMESENDSFNYHRPRKVVSAQKSGRVWYPIAGGAPFISCSSCFELLKLPRRYISLAKSEQKMKCGACSSTIVFDLGSKGFVVSASIRIDQVPTEIDNGSGGTADENVPYWQADSNSADMNACSKEYDDSQSKFLPTDEISNSGESEKQLDLSPTSSLSEDEQNPEKMPSEKLASPSAELPPAEVPSLPIPDLSSQECQNNSTDNIVSSRFDKGNKSKRSEPERIAPDRARSRQSSVKDGAVATEMDVSLNEFSNSGVSLDSVEISREHQPKTNKGGDSFFAGLIKKSFRDFKKSNQSVEAGISQVFVNGHFIPDRVVKKAEKLAGPIQPGEYWYDITAGFWGVMGHPCLGIVMPNIEEFDYPMPEKCAAGNTGVYVNGRELNQKDLDLLASRGLPITRHRSYIIEISGKVIDEDTGEELDGLGKLAPTVERANHGFGMKVPRFIAQLHN